MQELSKYSLMRLLVMLPGTTVLFSPTFSDIGGEEIRLIFSSSHMKK